MLYDSTVVKTVANSRHLVAFKNSNKTFRFHVTRTRRWALEIDRSSPRRCDVGPKRAEWFVAYMRRWVRTGYNELSKGANQTPMTLMYYQMLVTIFKSRDSV
ncbi:hypothetical protein AVEN_17767-1 [Araneus ventricosus]|uniref:Uncharacterized protein n=1 Tax=Araneus ventricosus TaxID=182803 RepID=A0A4Y2MV42_ARAVE|nr:hypothetical protein AVEN_17767-1 [Araneus ventricosus]